MRINRKNLYASHELIWFVIDFLMLGLLMLNLLWIIFDWLFAADFIQQSLRQHVPSFYQSYLPIHQNFLFYDLFFVAIFLTEFVLHWAWAVYRQTYRRWYFYPFIHWYDVIGCIPVAGARVLRFLRVFSILYRLHKYQIIDLTQNRVYKFAAFYYDVFLEELSDRIVVKVLSGTQEELRHGSPLMHRIQDDILLPRRELLVQWLSERLATASRKGYLPNEDALRRYLENIVDDAMTSNAEMRRIKQVPMLGDMVAEALENAVGDIVAEVIHRILSDMANAENHAFIEDMTDVLFNKAEEQAGSQTGGSVQGQVQEMAIEILELMKKQVMLKRWQDKL